MATRTFQTNITTEIFSDDGDKSISISQLGLTLKRDILTTPIETIITPLDITDVNTGNVITMDRLTYLPTGLAALTVPSNPTTCNFNDAIQLQDYNATLVPPVTHSEVKIGSKPASLFGLQINSNITPTPPTFTMSSDTPLTLSTSGYDLTLNAGGGSGLNLTSADNTNMSVGVSLIANVVDDIQLNVTNNNISLTTGNDIILTATNNNITLNATNDNIVNNSVGFQVNASDFISLTATNDPIDILADDYINIKTTDGNINLTAIDGSLTGLGKVYINNTVVNTGDGNLVVKDINATGNLTMGAVGSIIANSSNIELVSAIGAVTIGDVNNSFFGTKISLNDATQTVSYVGNQTWDGTASNTLNWNKTTDTLTITDGATTNTITKSDIQFTSTGTISTTISNNNGNDMNITADGTLTCLGNNLNLNANNNVNINATNDAISITADDYITLTSNGLYSIGLNAPNVNSYTYAMPICFTRQRTDSINYTFGGQNFELVYQTGFGIPQEFVSISPMGIPFTSTFWKIEFAFNMFQHSNPTDKGMGIYIEFIDAVSNVYTPITYNLNTPYSIDQKNFGYASGGNQPYLPINFTDYVDLATLYNTGTANFPLDMRIYFAGDSGFSSNFNTLLTLTRINIV